MTFVTHAYTGAVTYVALSRLLGVDAPVAAPVCGAVLGSANDTLDWVGAKLGLWPETWLKRVLATNRALIAIQILLVVPALHALSDMLVHDPVLPQPGSVPAYDFPLFRIFGVEVTRRDIHWLAGEALLVSLTTNVLVML